MEIKLNMRDCKNIVNNVTKKIQNLKSVLHASCLKPTVATVN